MLNQAPIYEGPHRTVPFHLVAASVPWKLGRTAKMCRHNEFLAASPFGIIRETEPAGEALVLLSLCNTICSNYDSPNVKLIKHSSCAATLFQALFASFIEMSDRWPSLA